MTPEHIGGLLGKRVLVESPDDSSRWSGRLVAYGADPSILIEQDSPMGFLGSRVMLPASYKISELPEPEIHICFTCGGTGRVKKP